MFVYPLQPGARALLNHPDRSALGLSGVPRLALSAEQMRSLPAFFADVPDPRRAQGRCHRLPVVLGLAAGAWLCGKRDYKAMGAWAACLNQAARRRFRCRRVNGRYVVPGVYVIRDCLIRVGPEAFEQGLHAWQAAQRESAEQTAQGATASSIRPTHRTLACASPMAADSAGTARVADP